MSSDIAGVGTSGLIPLTSEGGYKLSSGALLKIRAEWTGGAFCLIQAVVAPRFYSAPIHKHDVESQTMIVVSGRLGFYVEGSDDVELGPGGMAFRPAGLGHSFWNPTDEPAGVIEITSPGTKFQNFMLGNDELVRSGGLTRAAAAERAAEAGITLLPGSLDAELAAKHNVNLTDIFGKD